MWVAEVIFTGIFNILGIYSIIRLIRLFLDRKKNICHFYFILYVMVWGTNWFTVSYFQNPNITTLSLFVGLVIIVQIIFEGKVSKKITVIVVSMGVSICSENLVWYLFNFSLFPIKSEAVGSISSALLTLLIGGVIERIMTFDPQSRLPLMIYVTVVSISIISIVLAEIIITYSVIEYSLAMFILSLICLLNICIYYLYENIELSYKQKLKTIIMEQQMHAYANQFKIIYDNQNKIKGFRHDIKNHLVLLNAFIHNNKNTEAIHYIEHMERFMDSSREYVKSGNWEIDCILNYKLDIINDLDCKMDLKIVVPEDIWIPAFDLNIILGNLLDNMIDALQNVKKKEVSIVLQYKNGVMYICVENTFDGKVMRHKNKMLSKKKEKNEHGIGLENVKTVVQKYNGTMEIHYGQEKFGVDIILYLEEP